LDRIYQRFRGNRFGKCHALNVTAELNPLRRCHIIRAVEARRRFSNLAQKRARKEQAAEGDADRLVSDGVSDLNGANSSRKLVDELDGFDQHMMGVLYQASLSTIDAIPLDISSMWDACTTSVPRVLKAEGCWIPRSLATKELILATVDFLNDKATGCTYTVFRRGEKDNRVDPREAIAQLCDPESLNPIFLTGLRLPCILEGVFNTPMELSNFVEPYEETNHQLNLTPKSSFVDLHIGEPTNQYV
jgi:hypothetical protein